MADFWQRVDLESPTDAQTGTGNVRETFARARVIVTDSGGLQKEA